jgi:predicted Fe-S protein YdhL (DUF1289 family)
VYAWEPYELGERVLTNCTKDVIVGRKRCDVYRGYGRYKKKLEQRGFKDIVVERQRRAGVTRRCPCGEKPTKTGFGEDYISFCLGCSGVRVEPWYLPPELEKRPVMASLERRRTLRKSTRIARAQRSGRTCGPLKERRHHMYRVNIECGWMRYPLEGGDPWVGGY